MKYPFEAETKEEISIIPGQHIIIDKETPTYKDWLKGCCFETGRSGIFPANFTERSHEWKCWNLHWYALLLRGSPNLLLLFLAIYDLLRTNAFQGRTCAP